MLERERVEKTELSYAVVIATMENSMEVLRTQKVELPHDPAIPLLGTNPHKTLIQKDMHPYVQSSTIHNCQHMEAT